MKLNILSIVEKLLRDSWANRVALLKHVLPPLVILVVSIWSVMNFAVLGSAKFVDSNGLNYFSGMQKLGFVLLFLWMLYMIVRIIVTVHRIYYGKSETLEVWHVVAWDRYCWSFFIRFLAFILTLFLASLLLQALVGIMMAIVANFLPQSLFQYCVYFLTFILGIVMWYFYFRIMMVFPAAAVGDDVGIAESFALTQGNGIRLLVLLGVFPWLIKVPYGLVAQGVDLPISLISVLEIVLIILWTGMLTLSYQQLTSEDSQ